MKQVLTFLIVVLTAGVTFGQQYEIQPESQRINNKKYSGVSSKVDGEFSKVENYWIDYIKDNGKARRKRNYYLLTEFSIKDLGVDTIMYATRVASDDSLGLIWIAPFSIGLSDEEIATLNADLEKILKIGTRGYYISEVQKRIDQSEEAAIIVSKNHQKLIYEGEKLVSDSIAAANLKIELEQRLEETKLKLKVLSQKIADNEVAAQKAYEDLEAVKKVIEGHKESLKKIN